MRYPLRIVGRKDTFYLKMHSAHFNLRLYVVGHIEKEKKSAGSIPNGTLTELFLIPVSAGGSKSVVCTILSVG